MKPFSNSLIYGSMKEVDEEINLLNPFNTAVKLKLRAKVFLLFSKNFSIPSFTFTIASAATVKESSNTVCVCRLACSKILNYHPESEFREREKKRKEGFFPTK